MDIISYEIKDAFVVGDQFYYILYLKNSGDILINDTFSISVFSPSGNLIGNHLTKEIFLEPGATRIIVAEGGRENETGIFPFETAGDYKLTINSTRPMDFYKRFNITESGVSHQKYIRQNKIFSVFFDVMPRWQYNLYKNDEASNEKAMETNNELLNLTTELKNLTIDMNLATQNMKIATWTMLAVALFTVIIAVLTCCVA